jgi:hypothetical protein
MYGLIYRIKEVVGSSGRQPVLFVQVQAFQSAKCHRGLLVATRGWFSDNTYVPGC